MGILGYSGLVLAFIMTVVWVFMRFKKTESLGFVKDRVKQQLKAAKLQSCSSCNKGLLEPQFKWWRYFFSIPLFPFGWFIKGKPDGFRCTDCGKMTHNKLNLSSWTKYSSIQDLPPIFAIIYLSWTVLVFLGAVVIMVFYMDKILPAPK